MGSKRRKEIGQHIKTSRREVPEDGGNYKAGLTTRLSTSHPNDLARAQQLSEVTLCTIFLLSGTTSVTFLTPSTSTLFTPMNPDVENSSISDLVAASKCSVMLYPSFRAPSLHRITGA
jgi:hypothetical protein